MLYKRLTQLLSVAILTIGWASASSAAQQPAVKMSTSGICHCPGGEYFDKTSKFQAFESIDSCIANGGRQPSRGQGACVAGGPSQTVAAWSAPVQQSTYVERSTASKPYDRDLFGGWADADHDCMNTRHELLAELSTGPIQVSRNGCSVTRGRWLDPYTDGIYTNPRDLDIDHMVPLAYAWDHGAENWPAEKRVKFANDPSNLFAVQASANRQKGADGPLDWLPPSAAFHCQYLLRFTRISLSYGLTFTNAEALAIDQLTNATCGQG